MGPPPRASRRIRLPRSITGARKTIPIGWEFDRSFDDFLWDELQHQKKTFFCCLCATRGRLVAWHFRNPLTLMAAGNRRAPMGTLGSLKWCFTRSDCLLRFSTQTADNPGIGLAISGSPRDFQAHRGSEQALLPASWMLHNEQAVAKFFLIMVSHPWWKSL